VVGPRRKEQGKGLLALRAALPGEGLNCRAPLVAAALTADSTARVLRARGGLVGLRGCQAATMVR
jgi:hypothetical protein